MTTITKLASLVLFLILTSVNASLGQEREKKKQIYDDDDIEIVEHKFRVGITPTSMFNACFGIQANGAINFTHDIQFELEAGWIFTDLENQELPVRGIRIRPSLKWYYEQELSYQLYIGVGYNYRKVIREDVGRFRLPQGDIIDASYDYNSRLGGVAIMTGIDAGIRKNILLSFGVGIGLGTLNVEDKNGPQNGNRLSSSVLFEDYEDEGKYRYYLAILNLKFQYLF